MNKLRYFSKLLIPAVVVILYSLALYRAVTAPAPTPEVNTDTNPPAQPLENIPLPPNAPPIKTPQGDSRMAVSEKVLGVTCQGEFRAYVISEMPEGLSVINDRFGETPIVVIVDRENNYAAAFQATVGNQSLTFSSDGNKIMDATETAWNAKGKGLTGPLAGIQLEPVAFFITEWGNWSSLHQDTSIYGH